MKCAYCDCNNRDLVKKVFRVSAYNDVTFRHVCPIHWLACDDINKNHESPDDINKNHESRWFREEAEALAFAVTRSLS